MIKIIVIIWLVAIHAFAALAIWDTDLLFRIDRKLNLGLFNPPEISRLYDDMLGSHIQLDGSVEQGSVIFLGDSLTQGLNVSAVTNSAINYGIGMDSTEGLLKRIPHYESLNKASTIVVAIGINDLIRARRSPADVVENYKQILDKLPAQANIIMQAVFPVDESVGLVIKNKDIREINRLLAALAKEKGYAFINLHARFANKEGNLQKVLHVGDGIHFSTEAYGLWIQALNKQISSYLK